MPAFKKQKLATAISLSLPFILGGCGDDNIDTISIQSPDTYNYSSLLNPGNSSVDYLKASTQLALIKELEYLIGSEYLQTFGDTHSRAAVINLLNAVYIHGTTSDPRSLSSNNIYDLHDPENLESAGATPIKGIKLSSETSSLKQTNFSELTPGISLKEHLPGIVNDLHAKNNEGESKFIGWFIQNQSNHKLMAHEMIQEWFAEIALLATDGDINTRVFKNGMDYQALTSHFLMGAIAYGQASTNHLNPAIGLTLNNSESDNSINYTELQHNWDLAFGYYGAARQLKLLSNDDITAQADDGYYGTDIDINADISFNYPIYAVQRDISTALADTNFATYTMRSFLDGRQIIDDNFSINPSDNPSFQTSINQLASTALTNWELTIASTIVHQLNKTSISTIGYTGLGGDPDKTYATDWSTLKAQALALQFNPNTTMDFDTQIELHLLIGNTPERSTDINDLFDLYRDLRFDARQLMQDSYSFSTENTEGW